MTIFAVQTLHLGCGEPLNSIFNRHAAHKRLSLRASLSAKTTKALKKTLKKRK